MTENLSRPAGKATPAAGATLHATTTIAVGLVATLGATYVVSQFLRNAIGVLAPTLTAELGLSAPDLALIASIFFFVFVAAQIPLGVAIDRFGPKRCMLVCAVVVIAGTLQFAAAESAAEMVAARALMGLGTSCYLMAPLAFYARAVAPERFAMLAGLQLGLGTIGSLLGTAPLAFATAMVGWRAAFMATAVVMGLIGLLVALLVHEPPDDPAADKETLVDGLRGIGALWRQPDIPRLFFMNLTAYASYAMFVGLWGGPYLTHAYGYDLTASGTLLFIPALTQGIGMIVWGAADRLFGAFRPATFLGAGTTAALLLLLAAVGTLPAPALWVWLAAFGFCSAFLPAVIAHGRALFPPRLIGRGMTLMNMGTMGGGFLSQLLAGLLINLFESSGGQYPIDAYRAVFLAQSVLGLGGLLVYRAVREPLR
jgi:MFS family permease